jgi:hypothetical protein
MMEATTINETTENEKYALRRELDGTRRELDILRIMVKSANNFEGEVGVYEWWVARAVVRKLPCWQAVILTKGRESKNKRAKYVHEFGSAYKAIQAITNWFNEQDEYTRNSIGYSDITNTLESFKAINLI